MAKMYGFSGKVTGKKGDAVFSVRNGDQIIRQYNPIVSNPNTAKQVKARARMKLMSQLTAIYSPVIAMPKQGAVTSRNRFTAKNYALTHADASARAYIDLPYVQLTDSAREMQQIVVTRTSGNSIDASLVQSYNYSRVVYVVIAKNANGNLRVFDSVVVENSTPGNPNAFAAKMRYTDEAIVVYAYGLTDTNAKATAAFADIYSPTAESIAQLLASRSLNTQDYIATATTGCYMEVGTNDATSVQAGGSGSDSSTEQNQVRPQQPTIGGYTPFVENTQVTISGPAGATLYYTNDGTDPTTESNVYSAPFTLTAGATIKAIAVVNGVSSIVTTKVFTKNAGGNIPVVAPVISGTTPFTGSTEVTITAEQGAKIMYTTDGTTPTAENGTQYVSPFTLSQTTTVKAVAILQNTTSEVSTKVFSVDAGYGDTN